MNQQRQLPAVLTIAGSDSGGGAGIQADLRTFNAFKLYACSVITAITSQNPNEVRRVDILPIEAVICQLETILDAVPIRFAKTGMLANKEIIEMVANIALDRKLELVVDPVMVSTSGAQLLENSAVKVMIEKLFPIAKYITPNIPEAELICNKKITSVANLIDAAKMLYQKYGCNVVLKSGHLLDKDSATDIICYQGKLFTLSSPVVPLQGNTAHGTGCTLSSALVANLALGKSFNNSIIAAKQFVYGSLKENILLGDKLSQMYPAEKEYFEYIVFKELE